MATSFTTVYNRFLNKITDDMYMELTPADTVKDLQRLLIDAIPGFEFPRKNLNNYTIDIETIREDEITEDDFVIGILWDDLIDGEEQVPLAVVEHSTFDDDLTSEEINILAILMMIGWVQRQVTSIENTRMKYTGADFKMTSQANHLAKLSALLTECQRQSHHMQRLYRRRRPSTEKDLKEKTTGSFASNWDVLRKSVFDD